jgi:hypothetical protein
MPTIQEYIINIIHRFGQYVANTPKGFRVNFPRIQSRVFCDELLGALSTVDGSCGDGLEELLAFLASIRTAIEGLRGQDGIRAMVTFLNIMVSMLKVSFRQHELLNVVIQQNEDLRHKLDSLNTKITKMEAEALAAPSASLERTLAKLELADPQKESDVDATAMPEKESGIEETAVEWLADALPAIGSRDIKVLGSYMGVRRGNPMDKPCLVVLFEDMYPDDVDWMPPDHPNIQWQCINKPGESDEEETSLFAKFCGDEPAVFESLIMDFFDKETIDLFAGNSGITCMYPSVKMTPAGKYAPFFVVGVLSATFCAVCETDIPSEVITSRGGSVTLVLRDGLMLQEHHGPISHGHGISTTDKNGEHGSVCGVVADKETYKKYFVTCEHVLTRLENTLHAGAATLNLAIPSVQARKCCLLNALPGENGPKFQRSACSIGYYSSSQRLKHSLVAEDVASEVLLTEVRRFLHEGHAEFSCDIRTTVKLNGRTFPVTSFTNHPSVILTGDIGLIPVPPELEPELNFSHMEVTTFGAIAGFLKANQKVGVYLHGASSGFSGSRYDLTNFIHTKKMCFEVGSMRYPRPHFDRGLLGQYMISGKDFGTFGDSGGLVSMMMFGKRTIVGIFVGSFSARTKFIVTPADVLLENYIFVGSDSPAMV